MMFDKARIGSKHLFRVVLFHAMALTAYLHAIPSAWSANALPFEVVRVRNQEVMIEQVLDGTIEAIHQSTVSSQINGRVIAVDYDVDDYVAKDSILVRFKDTQQRAAVRQGQAVLDEARARLREAKARFDRIEQLFEKKLVSKQEVDQSRSDLQAAEARLEQAEGALEKAREDLEHTVVRAPYSGVVVERHVELGETANVGQPLMTGLSLEELRAVAAMPQSFIHVVQTHGKAHVIVPDETRERIPGQKLTFTPYADPKTHTFRVRVDLPPGEHGLYPGSFVKVAFVAGQEPRLLVPGKAIAYRSEVRGVYVVSEENRVSLRQVRLGRAHGNRIEVLAGLSAGERIALDPVRAAIFMKQLPRGQDE